MDDQHTMRIDPLVAATPCSKLRNGAHLISADRYQDAQRRDRRQKSNVADVKLYQLYSQPILQIYRQKRKAKRFMPVSSFTVGAGAFGDAVMEIREILALLLESKSQGVQAADVVCG